MALRILSVAIAVLLVGMVWGAREIGVAQQQSCQRVDKVIDGVYSFADQRSTSRKSSLRILASSSATPIQRTNAAATIKGLDRALAEFKVAFPIQRSASPTP